MGEQGRKHGREHKEKVILLHVHLWLKGTRLFSVRDFDRIVLESCEIPPNCDAFVQTLPQWTAMCKHVDIYRPVG